MTIRVFKHLSRLMAAMSWGYASIAWGQGTVAENARPAVNVAEARALLGKLVTVNLQHVPLRHAIDAVAMNAGVQIQYQYQTVDTYGKPVTVHLTGVSLGVALDQILTGTHLHVVPDGSTRLAIVENPAWRDQSQSNGVVAGVVTDARTKRPIKGAAVSLDGAQRGVLTNEDGQYRIASVSSGTHTVTVRYLGFTRQTRQVTVTDAGAMTLDVALEPSTSVLDQVVVTGTVVQTELKAVPNAMTVITAKDIEQRGITHIDQLFRGDVPGLFALNQGAGANSVDQLDEVIMFSRGATALSSASAGTSSGTNPIKTYVDGVEMADPQFLAQIDPRSIERIEILAGPQASTIYGSNAINGVMQIFTKRGTSNTPQLTLNLLSGVVQNSFSSALAPQHDYSAQVNGLEGRVSYNAGGSWNYMGRWSPSKQTARTGGFGGAKLDLPTALGRVTTDVTLRRSLTQNVQRGDAAPTLTKYQETGWYTNFSSSGVSVPLTSTLTGQTLGLTLGYAPTSWWSHEVGMGQDAEDVELRTTARGYRSSDDTTLVLQQTQTARRSLRYTTTARIPVTAIAQATITMGADGWQNLTSFLRADPQTLTGSLTNVSSVTRQPGHNTGGFLQTQLGIMDRLFLTYGLRAEWNPNFGTAAQPNYAPRYGVAYTQDLGGVTAKLRGSYGRSTRPPQPGLQVAQTIEQFYEAAGVNWGSFSSRFIPYYGGLFDYVFANPDLTPEHQQGGEGGLELYFGTRASLVVTRYNQTVDGLIDQALVDSVHTLIPCPPGACRASSRDTAGYGYYRQYEYLNIGSIRNQGWELQGSVNTGPLTTKGTYSWTKSRVIGITPKYRAYFATNDQYQPGATFRYLPEHTWALGVTYAQAQTTMSLNVTGIARVTDLRDDAFFEGLSPSIRLPQNQLNVSNPFGHVFGNKGYVMADLAATHRMAAQVDALLQVQNATNHYTDDYNAAVPTLGRQTKLGARVKF